MNTKYQWKPRYTLIKVKGFRRVKRNGFLFDIEFYDSKLLGL